MTGLILDAKISENLVDKVISVIDHIEKISKEEMIQEFNKIGINEAKACELLELFNMTIEQFNHNFKDTNNELIKEGLKEISEINDLIKKFNLDQNATFTPSLARGLSIYTGLVFEFFDKKERLLSSLGGGGRYNKIITEFIDDGNIYPACGLSFGLEPIYAILKEENKNNPLIDCLIIPMEEDVVALSIANTLRDNNIKTVVEMNKRKIKKSFEFANKSNIKYVIVIGSDEVANNKYSLKNMETGEQLQLTTEEIINKIKSSY